MIVMGTTSVINAFLTPIFIFGFNMGLEGAAWATVTSSFIGLMILTQHVALGKSSISHDFTGFKYRFNYVKSILSVGLPASMSNIIMSIGMFFFTAMVAQYGVEALAAFGIGYRLDSLALLFGIGVTVAIVSIVGQSLGAKDRDRAREATIKGGLLASAIMTSIGVFYYAFAIQIVSAFNTDEKVIEYGVELMRILPLTYIVVGISMCISGAFLGAGKAMLSMSMQAARVLLFSAPAAYILSNRMGLRGIWWGILIGSYLAFAYAIILYKFTKWDK
jgi:putative MATE family efflux protein